MSKTARESETFEDPFFDSSGSEQTEMQKSSNSMTEADFVTVFLREQTPESFSAIVDEYTEMLRRMIYRIVMNEHDTDDIVQESFVDAYHRCGSFKGKSKFSTWLCRIAYNKAYGFLRKKYGKNHLQLNEEQHERRAGTTFRPDAALNASESLDQITNAMKSLPEYLRMTITLIAIDEVSIGEAAFIMDCPKATVYWRLHKARKMLKKKLGHLMSQRKGGTYE